MAFQEKQREFERDEKALQQAGDKSGKIKIRKIVPNIPNGRN